jgi:hypothetical protein
MLVLCCCALNIMSSSQSLTAGKAVYIDDLYKEVSKRVHSKSQSVRAKNKGIMVLWGDLLSQVADSKAIGLKDCASKKGNFAFLGSPSSNAESLISKCRVEPFNSLAEIQANKVGDPKKQQETDWNKLDALRFAIADTKGSKVACPSVAQLKADIEK